MPVILQDCRVLCIVSKQNRSRLARKKGVLAPAQGVCPHFGRIVGKGHFEIALTFFDGVYR